jgi:hypothetical protein
MARLASASLAFACLGLLLVCLFQPGQFCQRRSIAELAADCHGAAAVEAEVRATFFTKSGSPAATFVSGGATVSAVLPGLSAFPGDRLALEGRASASGGRCWLFVERMRHV